MADEVWAPVNRPAAGPGSRATRTVMLFRDGSRGEFRDNTVQRFNPDGYELSDSYPRQAGDHGLFSNPQMPDPPQGKAA